MDFDLSLDDMISLAYRLSWPAPTPKTTLGSSTLRRTLRRAIAACRREPLEGWPVMLSAPACS